MSHSFDNIKYWVNSQGQIMVSDAFGRTKICGSEVEASEMKAAYTLDYRRYLKEYGWDFQHQPAAQ